MTRDEPSGLVFDIQGYCTGNGPGTRTCVYLCGCSLRCEWCANPEGQQLRRRLTYAAQRCVADCHLCADACPHGAIEMAGSPGIAGRLRIDRKRCVHCERLDCIEACSFRALSVCGQWTSVSSLMELLERHRASWGIEGGVTFTGGDPLVQHDFVTAALEACGERWIHAVVETAASAPTAHLLRVAQLADLLLIDLKHHSPVAHERGTGRDNHAITENLRALAAAGIDRRVRVRIPVVPGFNDSSREMEAMAAFLVEIGQTQVELVPFHDRGVAKYIGLGLSYSYAGRQPPGREELERLAQIFDREGLACSIGGDLG